METLLWIGLTSTDTIFEDLVNKGYSHAPTFYAQKNIITGIENNTGLIMHSINGFMMPSIPNCNEIITRGMEWAHCPGAQDSSVLSINIKYIDFIVRKILMKKKAKDWVKTYGNYGKVTVFVYAASEPYLEAAMEIKKKIPEAHVCLIVPDLPQYMELNGSKVKKYLKELRWGKLQKLIIQSDSYILFSKHMANFLELDNKKWMTMEGSINLDDNAMAETLLKNEENEKIIVMYSGAMGLKYGIPELLDAFSMIENDNYELWFTGNGNADDLVKKRASVDKRIKHYGFLPSRENVLALQHQSTILINMRMPNEVASAYCFPSKIFEYLLSGKPTLSFKIDGIPDEYYKYLFEMKSPDPKHIKEAIIKLGNLSQEERDEVGKKGREFVLNEKNNVSQAKKIVDFLCIGDKEKI